MSPIRKEYRQISLREGYEMTSDEASADVVIFNTCSVREKAEHKLFTQVGHIRHTTGESRWSALWAASPSSRAKRFLRRSRAWTLFSGQGLLAAYRRHAMRRRTLESEVNMSTLASERRLRLDRRRQQRHSPYVAFVPIIEGCNKFCTYCIVPFSRGQGTQPSGGRDRSTGSDLSAKGVREVHLIGQNVNSYRPDNEAGLEGFAGKSPFSRLLRAVAATGIERIKFTTHFPRDFQPDIVEAIENTKISVIGCICRSNREATRFSKHAAAHTIDRYTKRSTG